MIAFASILTAISIFSIAVLIRPPLSSPETPLEIHSLQPTVTPFVSPKLLPSASIIPTPNLTNLPISTTQITPKPVAATQTPQPKTHQTYQDRLLAQVNAYRQTQGLPTVGTDPHVCNFAALRAEEISHNFSHDGFQNRINDSSFPYPSYSEVVENIGMVGDENLLVSLWSNSATHAENMRKDTPYACIARVGNYYAYEGWKP